eukprot:4652008-Pleurochrysis_carterae.AAC.1
MPSRTVSFHSHAHLPFLCPRRMRTWRALALCADSEFPVSERMPDLAVPLRPDRRRPASAARPRACDRSQPRTC